MLTEVKPISSSNIHFLKELFFAVKSDLFLGLPKKLQHNLLNMQFQSQQQHYHSYWPNAEHKLLIYNKVMVGQVIIEKSKDHFYIVDIKILPSFQKQGIGTQYLLALIKEAKKKNKSVKLSVDKNNRALTLYKRIGFKIITDEQTHYAMEIS
jgi:ribosomal protein S18 acetylase RimI-like enzyme